MKKLIAKLKRHDERRALIVAELQEARANLFFPCGCGEQHKIKDCDVIQTHWYTPPRSCYEGDYWNTGELQIVCPASGHRNRVLSSVSGDLEKQFRSIYKSLFRSVIDNHNEDLEGGHWNSYFLKDNVEYYGLQEKKS